MSKNINISTVSAKATLKNEGFLSKLSSTLMTRRAPPPEAIEAQTSLVWHKTSDVKERIKTATGTIPVYSDMSQEDVEKLKESVATASSLEEVEQEGKESSDVFSTVIAESTTYTVETTSERSTESKMSANMYIVIDDYTPDTDEGLTVVGGQKVEVINDFGGKSSKRLRIETDEEVQLLDNSAAKHKMAIRPKKKHPHPRARGGQDYHEERWLVKDSESEKQGLVPSRLLGAPPPGTEFATSIKRSLQEMTSEESLEMKRKLTREMKELRSSKQKKSSVRMLGPSPEEEAMIKRTATIKELIETEEEFVKDLEFVVRNYYALFDEDPTPKHIRDQKDTIFGNFKFIADFHQNVLIEGVKYHSDVPNLIGKTFLRLERDFDKHSEYCTTEPVAEEYLEKNRNIKDYFEEFSERIGDDKRIEEHLKLPIQRLNDYQLLIKEIIKFSNRLGDETADLERAHDLMQTIPQRATDAKFLASIEGFKGNLFKLGRLIRHDWFAVTEEGHKTRDRYLFLFKARILVTKVRRITEDRSIFVLRDIIRLPETSLCGLECPTVLEFHHIEPQNHPNFPIVLEARSQDTRAAWLEIVKEHVIDTASVDDLLFDDEIRVVSDEGEDEEPGHISPPGEGGNFVEELPEDLERNQVVPVKREVEIAIRRETSGKPVSIKEQSHIEEEFVFISEPVEKVIPIKVEKSETKDIPIKFEKDKKVIPVEVEFDIVPEVEVSSKRALDKEEEALDFWSPKKASPPTKRRIPFRPEESSVKDTVPIVEEPQTPVKTDLEVKEDDFWSPKKSAVFEELKIVEVEQANEPETKDEGSDFWTPKKSSPLRKRKQTKELKLELEESIEEDQTKEKEAKKEAKPVSEVKKTPEVSSKRPKEEEEDAADFWAPTKSSPPLKRRATPKVTEHISAVASEVSETKEDLKLEQVEISAFKAEAKVAEQKKEFTLQTKEEGDLKGSDQSSKTPVKEPVVPALETKLSEDTLKRELKESESKSKETTERRRVRKVCSKTDTPTKVTEKVKEPKVEEKEPEKVPDVKKPEPEKKESEKKPEVKEPEKKPELKEPEKKPEVKKTEKKPEVKEPEKKREVKEPEKKPEVKEPEKNITGRKSSLGRKSKTEETKTLKEEPVLQPEPIVEVPKSLETPKQKETKVERKEAPNPEEEKSKLKTETGQIPKEKKEEILRGPSETATKDLRTSTTMDSPTPLVGLVGEDRPEAQQSRHAHTSVAAAWRAPVTGPKPLFTKSLVGDVVEPGDGTTFSCEIEHPSQYYVTWLKDNKVLDDKLADRVLQHDENSSHTLKILHCLVEDSGVYTAKATDNNGLSATSSAQLLVQRLTEEERAARIADKKPFFLVKMMPTEVIENTNLSYAVHVKGDPMPNVTFFKDNKPMKEDDRVKVQKNVEAGRYELVIGHVQMSDAGLYKCVAMNKFEKAECEAVMAVIEEKTTLQNLQGKGSLLQPGEAADFKWFRDGIEFDPIERFNVMFKDEEDTLALVFQNVTPDDAGIYTCVASTSCGKISCSAELTVEGSVKRMLKDPEPPAFEEELSDNYVTVGGTVMMECRISGYPKPELTWSCNGMDLKIGGRIKQMWEDDESVTLIMKNITEADRGLYNVKATNELGEADSSARLMIRTAPKFRKIEKQVTCNIGQPLNFIVEVNGEPIPELKWLKDGKEISSDRIQFDGDGMGKFWMKIDEMDADDCGSFSVMATNDMGQRTEQFEIMTDTPPEITRGLDHETEKKASNDHTFEVRANGSPSPDAVWFKNGREISTDDKFKITKDGNFYMLKLRSLTRSDRGLYKIVLTNRNGTDESQGELSIRGPPEFTTPLKPAFAKEGAKDTKMFVEWDANPRPSVKWFFNDKAIHEDTPGYTVKSTDTTSMLVIHQATPEFTGTYTIKASNEYGDKSSTAKFRLHEVPQIIEPLKDVEFLEGTKCKFQCKVSGCPLPEVKWTKDGKKWTPDDVKIISRKEGEDIYFLFFEEVKTDDSARYSGIFTNVEGNVTSEGSITVNTPPHITGTNFKEGKKFVANHKFVLEVEATAVPEAEATWYLDGRELKEKEDGVKYSYDGKVYKLERPGCDPDHTGEYKCKLKNKIKEAEESGLIQIVEKEARARLPLKNVNVKENTDGRIQCQLVGDPMPTVEWFRNGKPIMPSERIIIEEDREKKMHYLTFKNIIEADKSTFTLVGKNEFGECETSCVMSVLVAPQPGELQDATVDWGRDLWLSVYVHAVPPPEITWLKNGQKLDESERILHHRDEENENYSFEIKTTVVEDGATYSYKAVNEAGEASGQSVVTIHTEEPTVVTYLVDMSICLEDEVTFTTECAGLPMPEVEWRNKDTLIKDDDRYTIAKTDDFTHTLTIKDIRIEDYGTITATAINLVSKVSCSSEFTQQKLACEVLEGLENVTRGGESDEVSLNVLIRGSPRPAFVWTKDGDEVEATANIKLSFKKKSYCEATISLTLVEASSADSGQYRLRFFNDVNEAQTETALVVRPVRRKPKISGVPGDLNVSEMEPGTFKCKIAGYPRPEVTWMKEGRVVRPTDILNSGMTADGEFFLEFKKVTLEDAGKYTIVAKNDEGKVEHDMHLNVNPSPSKPKFLCELKPTKVIAGYPCRMEVILDGFPRPKVAWLKNGKPVEIDGNHIKEIVTDDGRVILQIADATDDDAGEYSAVASNDLGDNSSSATLSVLDHERKDGQPDGPPCFSEGLKDSSFDEGKTIKLPVSIRGGPVPNMKWYKDGKEVKLGKRAFFTYDGDKTFLEIEPCEGADSGMYKCVIDNPNGKKETECEVTVRKCFEPPSFTYLYPNQQQLPGLDSKFTIKVDGVPKPEISWFFNGKKISPDGEKYRIRKDADGCTLFVKETTYSDSGAYKVIAKNKEGETEHEASLVVADDIDPTRKAEAPNILKAIGDQELYEGYTAKFKAVVSGRPQPDFVWYKNGEKLFPSNRYVAEMDEDGLIRLTIKYICQEDAGVYELRVWNEHGKATCKGKLICECISKHKRRPVGDEYKGFDKIRMTGAPIPLSDRPIISALSDRRCTLSWTPFMSPGPMPPVTYQVERCEYPAGDWITTVSGIRGCSVDLTNLCPKSDYKFRVRVENKYGVSEPSQFVGTFRSHLERNPISHEPYLEPSRDIPCDGPYVPAGFQIDRSHSGNFYAPPRFLRLDHDTQYGMKNFSGHVKWIGYGYPTPKLRFYFKDEELHFGPRSRYTYTQEADGEIFLFFDNITEVDVGWYRVEAFNEYGISQQRIRLGLSEYPRVLQHLRESHIKSEGSGRIFCRISAYPPCDVTWFKDWHEIKTTTKLRPQFIEPDMYCLNLSGVSTLDTGLYSMAAVNVAGSVSSSCMVNVEDNDALYNWNGYGRGKVVGLNTRHGTLEDHYDIGDELGRGTQGITYYCRERYSGRNFAAKSMWGTGDFMSWMHNEFEMMNFVNSCNRIARLYDAYEGHKNMVLVMELCAGGELLHHMTQHQIYTEYEVAFYVRQMLEGLDYMHDRWIAHLGLNIGDIMVTRQNGTDIRMSDLSLSRNIRLGKLRPLEYGMPEFVAPEVVKGENVTYAADMWSIGVITYLLLSGTSPFRGENDRETLTRIKNGELRFDVEAFADLSEESKDFIAKLLQYQPEHRLNVKAALVHPWIKFAEMTPHDPYRISTDRLKTYYMKYKEWYLNASSRRWYRRRTLASAFTHPSKMVYPPGEIYTPPETPEREIVPAKPEDYSIPERDLSYEIGDIRSDSHYQKGPDTYLLQLRDTDFPVRLRSYMNLTRERSPIEMFLRRDIGYDYERIPVVHERRRFTDIMDEEIADERRRTMIDKYTSGFIRSKQATCSLDLPKRVQQEITPRAAIKEVIKTETKDKTKAPFLREKPPTTAVTPNMDVVLTCVVTGNPEPVVQWFRNDIILGETSRITFRNVGGQSQMSIKNSNDYDLGFYKVVARNDFGQAIHRFRIVRGEIPGMCDPPQTEEASGTQILLKWTCPIDDGGAAIELYHLQMKSAEDEEWSTVCDYIAQEEFLVEGLTPVKPYQFRVAARNIRGRGDFSISTGAIRTASQNDPCIEMPLEQQLQQNSKLQVLQLPGARGEIRDVLDYSREIQNVPLKSGETATLQMRKYQMVKEICRGRFSRVMRCIHQDDQRTFSCKILLERDRGNAVKHEYEAAKSLRHERLTTMYETCELPDVTVFIMEHLGGPDILTFLANKLQYTEQHVSVVINQVLDALSYLHWRGLCHLDIQPDNVVVTSAHKVDVKLGDFGTTQKVDRAGTQVEVNGLLDYIAPEVMFEQTAYPSSDIWSVGVLTYVLLTGKSPFEGEEEEETLENIQCVRSKFETLGELASPEATRFILLIFKRDPSKRPTEEECRDHTWLGENDFMVRKRERLPLSTTRLREYSTAYHRMRQKQESASNIFTSFMDHC